MINNKMMNNQMNMNNNNMINNQNIYQQPPPNPDQFTNLYLNNMYKKSENNNNNPFNFVWNILYVIQLKHKLGIQ